MTLSTPLQRHIKLIGELHPWYADWLSRLGVSPHASELAELPLVTAEVLEQTYYAAQNRTEPGLSVYRTSGTSSGKRKAIYYSEPDDELYIKAKMDSFREWLGDELTTVRRALADMGTGHAASTAVTIFEKLGFEASSLSFSSPIDEHIERLESFKPDLLYTMPSILEAITAASKTPAQYGIRKIIVVGEIATLEWQANMAARFGIRPVDILDTYGSIEIGAIAAYSHKLGKYVLSEGLEAEALPAERIDPRFEPLKPNEGVLVLTSYVRTLFPAVRFVTYDVVRDFETVVIDGVPRHTFSCLSKRVGPELKHGEKISLYDIEEVVNRFLSDAELRVRISGNQLSVHIKSPSLDEASRIAIREAIETKIPEIGEMIQNKILSGIEVTKASDNEQLERGAVKSKKLYS